jgi:putative phosphoesterase
VDKKAKSFEVHELLLGVISDTHDNLKNIEKVAKRLRLLNVDMVVHLGDIVAPFSLAKLAETLDGIKLVAIFGNNCGEKSGLYKTAKKYNVELFEPPHTLTLEGRRILLIHGWGSTEVTEEIVEALVSSGKWDAVFYGHTHKARLDYIRGRLLLNPGEVAGVLYEPSFAVVDLSNLKASLFKVE